MKNKEKKSDKKEKVTPPKGKAYVDTSNSKVVKGTNKDEVEEVEEDKAVVERIHKSKNINTNMKNINEEFINSLFIALNEAIKDSTMKASYVNKWLNENSLEDVISKIDAKDNKYQVEDIIKLISDQERKELQSEVVTSIDKMDENSKNEIESKFNVGDKVYYIPELSGMDKEKGLIINFKKYEKSHSLLGEEPDYNWYYSFENSNLRAVESDLTDNLQSLSESSATEKDIETEDDNGDADEEKESNNTPDTKAIKEENELTTDDDEFDEDDAINDNSENDDVIERDDEGNCPYCGEKCFNGEMCDEQQAGVFDNSTNEDKYNEVHRLLHLMKLKENANELFNKYGLTNIEKIKESIGEDLTDDEFNIVLDDIMKVLKIEVANDLVEDESISESLRNDLGNKLI